MSEIISLSPTMQNRLNFKHELLDHVDDYKMELESTDDKVTLFLENRAKHRRDEIILGYMWLAKDLVCRFRAHWPEVRHMTDDLASEALSSLTEFVDSVTTHKNFFNKAQAFIHGRLREYINDNRSTFSSSKTTNERREKDGEPLEYNYAASLNEELTGEQDYHPNYVDILDNVERLTEVDHEQMRDLITHFLEQDHNINEESLSEAEREALDKLSNIGRDML